MVISLLIIQAKKSNFTTIDQFIEKAQQRINAISLVHENLYQSEYFDEGSIKEYIVKLVSHIESNLDSTTQKVSFMTNITGIMLNIQTMIACGLIINELVTNSLKYAFENIVNPLIQISFTELPEYFVLRISDNGNGMLHQNQKKTMGFELVRMLTLQLNGDCKFKNSNGLSVIITFPKTNKT